jgi:4-amino-4-deoxy-L-arabinose transferase-like glycosyltransferase
MIVDSLGSVLAYLVLSIGIAWPVAARLICPGPERILTSVTLSLFGVFLFAWAVYICALPLSMFWVLPIVALTMLAGSWRSLVETWRNREVRELLIAQMLVTGWCIGWLALVVTYSGGGWAGDWFGHWQRTVFFLERGPRDILFNGFDPLTSRPPLANVVTGAFVALTRNDYAHYQLALTFLGSLAFLPAALLARRFGGRHAMTLLAVLMMVNPMFVQNATYAWTKLPAAFFTLAALYYFLRTFDHDCRPAGVLFAVTLGAALLTHYSAGPYAIVLAAAWIARGSARRYAPAWWRETAVLVVIGAVVLATWFAWSLSIYGVRGTFLTSTTVTDKAATAGAQFLTAALNLRDTLIPHFLRTIDYGVFAQASAWGWWRDWFFQLYQLNLVFVFGSIAWLVIALALLRNSRTVAPRIWIFWTLAITSTTILGIVVHSGRDPWGLVHICLQPLVLLGLAFLAARWDALGRFWQRLVVAGAVVDFVLGIALQFGAQSFLLDQWLAPHRTAAESLRSYSSQAVINLHAKSHFKLSFFGDSFVASDTIVLMFLGALLLLALVRAAGWPSPHHD